MKVRVYGCRGSLPTTRDPASRYGSNTSCIALEVPGQTIILDAGSGIAQMDRFTKLFARDGAPFDILLSHLHIDHLIGLTVFSKVWLNSPDELVRIYTLDRDDRPLKEQIFGLFTPPYWPVSMVQFANAECIAVQTGVPFALGGFTVTPFGAAHPDKTASFHITDGSKVIVYLLDSETPALSPQGWEELVGYCENADLVVFDAAYSVIDYPDKKGWGHSTIEDGFKLAEASGCKKMMFTHFGFEYSDQELEIFEFQVAAQGDVFFFARDGFEFILK
ncbi:MAG: MBL fold metallo-hydrolase [Defluviitaleaceae bacterium]|nr:MBL fold metallo-hydrolase [Defluviitaleaceae bacterium]MCL2275542.1 MBL fold metallo-hydrolase [Defluviitaleaceae bacterium]